MSDSRRVPPWTWLALGFCWVAIAAFDFQHSSRPFVTGFFSLVCVVAAFWAFWNARRPTVPPATGGD
jgi:hypothetical protein